MSPTPKQFIREILRLHPDYREDDRQMSKVARACRMMGRVLPELKPGLVSLERQLVRKYKPLVKI